MKIAIFNPQSEFTQEQQKRLSSLGTVVYTPNRKELPLNGLLEMAKGAEIIGVDPDPLGGFEKAKVVLTKIMESLPKLQGVSVDTTDVSWIDLEYCKQNNVVVSNIPKSNQRETIAEHTVALLLCLAKKIIKLDRKTREGKYILEQGVILQGKTLGIIGLGTIGSRVAEIAHCFGMNVIAYNHSPMKQKNVAMKSMEDVLRESDAISIHVPLNERNKGMIGIEEIQLMKQEVMIVNTADRRLVNEQAMADALISGKVYGYIYEGEDLINTPLANIDNAIGLQSFGWYTKEALQNLFQIWVDNILAISINKPQNIVRNL